MTRPNAQFTDHEETVMSMRVVHATRFGGPEVLVAGDEPEPSAGPGRVVVKVAVAEVLFLDTQLRSGWGGEHFSLEAPYVPGTGVAGAVISVGDGVDPGWIGRQVIARTPSGTTGGYAQRAEAVAEEVFEVPDGTCRRLWRRCTTARWP